MAGEKMIRGHACSVLFALVSMTGTAVAHPPSTLSYTSPQTGSPRHLSLRRNGAWLQIVDDDSSAIVAASRVAETEHVAIRGADGDDDALTVDLRQRLTLPGGIDYDGGRNGWDTLIVSGGRAKREAITQLTPHDGSVDVDGLVIRYVNLEPVVDTVPAASYTINGTAGADTVTISDGPVAGQVTISSPTFESVTFANKANVIFDGMGGGDSVTIDNPNPPAGLASLNVQNVAGVAQISPLHYPALGVSASGAITLADYTNDVRNIELLTQSGDITYNAIGDVTIGGVSAVLSGLRVQDSGAITVYAGGTITLADTDGADMAHAGAMSGDITMFSGLDVTASVANATFTSPAGRVDILAGRDLLLGTSGADAHNDARAATNVLLTAGRDMLLDGKTQIRGSGHNTNAIGIDTQRRFILNDAMLLADGSFAYINIGSYTFGGAYSSTGTLALNGGGSSALSAYSVGLVTDHLSIGPGSGIDAKDGVDVQLEHTGLNLGDSIDSPDAMAFSNDEAARVNSSFGVQFYVASGFDVHITQPISVPYGLIVFCDHSISATGSGSLAAPLFELGVFGASRTYDIDGSGITVRPGGRIPFSGGVLSVWGSDGPDVFNVTPSSTTTIDVTGDFPEPPASPGDVLYVNQAGSMGGTLTDTITSNGHIGTYVFADRATVNFQGIETLGISTDLGVTLSDSVATTTPGATLTYTLVATNNGPLGVARARITDAFPVQLKNVAWTCNATAGSSCAAGGAGNVDEDVDLAADGRAAFHITATVDAAAAGSITDSATIAPPAGIGDSDSSNDSASDTDSVVVTAGLGVTMTAAQTVWQPDRAIDYTITLRNAGPNPATQVVLTNVLPAGTTFNSLRAPPGFDCRAPMPGNPGTVQCSVDTLAPATYTLGLTLNLDFNAAGTIVDTVDVAATSADPEATDNSASASVAPAISDLSVMKTADRTVYVRGEAIVYTIALVNAGPDAASEVTFTDLLPTATTFASINAASGFACGTPSAGEGGIVTCGANDVAVGTYTFTLTVHVSGTASGPIANGVDVSASNTDPNVANNASTTTLAPAGSAMITPTPLLSQAGSALLLLALLLAALSRLRHRRVS